MNACDLIIVGAGIVGAACAACASAEGLRVAIVEPGPIGGGATAASMGHLVAMGDSPAELALTRYSLGLWDDAMAMPSAEYQRCGTLWIAEDDRDCGRIEPLRLRLQAVGIHAETVDAAQLRDLEPALVPGLAGGLLVPGEGVVFPPAVAHQWVERARRHGAVLHRRRATVLRDGEVVLDDGAHLRGTVLVATGCALPGLLPMLPLRRRKGHLVITERYPRSVNHQLVQLGYADSVHGDASSVAFNVQPRPTGQILIGSSREYDSDDAAVSLSMVRRMLQRAFRFLPGLQRLDASRAWAGFRPASIDGLPYIGRVPGHDHVWVAAGHEGLGVTTAPGSARLLLDLLLGRRPAIDPAPYDPARVAA